MSYPQSIDSVVPVSGTTSEALADHANMHNSLGGSVVVAIENVLGTTAGTALLRNANIGDFCVTSNFGGTLQQNFTGGVANNMTLGSPAITGGTANSQTLSSPTITGLTVKPVFLGTTIATGTTAGTGAYVDLLTQIATVTVASNVQINIAAPLITNNGGDFIERSQILRGTGTIGPTDIYTARSAGAPAASYSVYDLNLAAGTYTYHWQWLTGGGTATITNPALTVAVFPI